MSKEITVKVGTKVEPEEAKKINPAELGVGIAAPPEGEVSGQAVRVICPWCGSLRLANYGCSRCGNCGGVYCI